MDGGNGHVVGVRNEFDGTVGGSWLLGNGLLGDSVLVAAVTTGLGLAVAMGLAMDVGNGRTGMFSRHSINRLHDPNDPNGTVFQKMMNCHNNT
jgi:hypothetical protein